MRFRPALFACAFALAAAPPASAATPVTVTVPVEFKNLNAAVTNVDVSCRLTGKDPVTLAERTVGGESQVLRLTGGNYTGPSPLTFTFVSRARTLSKAEFDLLASASGGSCEFKLLTQGGGDQPTAGDTRPVFAQQPGAPFRQRVTFTFK